jgi:trans-aconitate methyltransferase
LNNHKKVQSFFSNWAISGRHEAMAQGHIKAVTEMLKHLSWGKSDKFLDVGCGNGWLVRLIAKYPGVIASKGVDFSEEMIQHANDQKESLKESFERVDFLEWESNERFNIIFSMEVFYYFFPVIDALKKAYALLEYEGRLMIGIDYYSESKLLPDFPNDQDLPKNLYSKNKWVELFSDAGFKSVNTFYVDADVPNGSEVVGAKTLVIEGIKHDR